MIPFLLGWNSLLTSSLSFLALDQSPLGAAHKGLQGVVLGFGLVLSAILTALICGIYFLFRYRQGLLIDDPGSMFRELCRVHDLTGPERRLMKRLALGLDLSCPSALFVDSALWRLPDGSERHPRISKADWDKLLKLQRTLFLPPPANVTP